MNIGIMVHSKTGNTYSVAEKVRERLMADGHSVTIESLTPVGTEEANPSKIRLQSVPDADLYDALIVAGPVRGFSMSPVLGVYLKQVQTLKNKRVGCFVTQHLKYPWMGGKHAISQMSEACRSKGATVVATGIVNWSSPKKDQMIDETVEALSRAFKE